MKLLKMKKLRITVQLKGEELTALAIACEQAAAVFDRDNRPDTANYYRELCNRIDTITIPVDQAAHSRLAHAPKKQSKLLSLPGRTDQAA